MIPTGIKSSTALPAMFKVPYRHSALQDYEQGGADVSDLSTGLESHLWFSLHVSDRIEISNNVVTHTIVEVEDITYHSFCFDQNMNTVCIYNKDGKSYLYWYDPTISSHTTTLMPVYMEYPQITLDDKRASQVSNSDILLSYMREDKLYIRIQRERYMIEHFVADLPNQRLTQVGMDRDHRIRWRYVTKIQGE